MQTIAHAQIMPTRLAHANIFVSDLDASREFYMSVCGLHEVFQETGIGMSFLSNGNTHHDVALMQTTSSPLKGRDGHLQLPAGRGSQAGLNHFAFEMYSERSLVEAYGRLLEAGVRVDRTTDHQIAKSMYLYDRNGYMFEFYCDSPRDWRKVYAESEGQLISSAWAPGQAESADSKSYIEKAPHIEPRADAILPSKHTVFGMIASRHFDESCQFVSDVVGLIEVAERKEGRTRVTYYRAAEGAASGFDLAVVESPTSVSSRSALVGVRVASPEPLVRAHSRLKDEGHRCAAIGEDDSENDRGLLVWDPDGLPLLFVAGDTQGVASSLIRTYGTSLFE